MGLAPTSSTTALLVLGDMFAVCLSTAHGFGPENYARVHPGGALGRRLARVSDVMRSGPRNPVISVQATVREAIAVMTRTPGRPGAVSVVDDTEAQHLVGFFTDGDLRRLLESEHFVVDTPIASVMARTPKTVGSNERPN